MLGLGLLQLIQKLVNFGEWCEASDMHNMIIYRDRLANVGDQVLRPGTNYLKRSYHNDLITIPSPVPPSPMRIVRGRWRKNGGYDTKLRCNPREPRGGFALEARFALGPCKGICPKRLPAWVSMDGENPRLLFHY